MDKIIDKIINLYYEINNIYLDLYKLELSGMKKDDSFIRLVQLLKRKILEEKRLFSKIDDDTCMEIFDVLSKNSDDALSMRICDYIVYNVSSLDFKEYCDDSSDEELLSKLRELYIICNNNVFLVYLSMIQEYLNSDIDSGLRDLLLNLKYYNSFTKHDIEGILVECNFGVAKENYVNLYLIADSLGLGFELSKEVIMDNLLTIINVVCMQLLNINDSDYISIDKLAISINEKCMLRACLALLNEFDYERIKRLILSNIKDNSNDNNTVSRQIIDNILCNRKKDKGRVKKLSMRIIED